MRRLVWLAGLLLVIVVTGYIFILPQLGRINLPPLDPSLRGDAARGSYIATASGCYVCHTNEKAKGRPFAGGRSFKTPFGTIYAPNITADMETGIGSWSLPRFRNALREGVREDHGHYYPAFPYTSYAHMHDQDVADLKAYFATVAPVVQANRPTDMPWPFADRRFTGVWKWLYAPRRPRSDLAVISGKIPRGTYLVEVLGHCAECHTQRNAFGGYTGTPLAGNTRGPNGGKVPDLRSIGEKWSRADIVDYLSNGMTPDGDFVGGEMGQVVDHSTSKLTNPDQNAIAAYLLDLQK